MVEMKTCKQCGETKPVTAEFWHMRKKTGKPECSKCRLCRNANCLARMKQRYAEDPDFFRAKNKERYCTEKHRQYHAAYVAKDPEGYKARRRAASAKRRATVKGALNNRMQTAIWHALRESGLSKSKRMFELVGWTIDELKAHLEPLFEDGMGWHNMKEWHIDHIIPMAMFDIRSVESPEFRELWALRNLAPLWKYDNIVKSAEFLWQLPDHYKNPKLRARYPRPVSDAEFLRIIELRNQREHESGRAQPTQHTESRDSFSSGLSFASQSL